MNDNLKFDKQHIWHPYTAIADELPIFQVTHAKGVYLYLSNGKRLIDGMASWWSVIHGYNHPYLNQAISKQLENMAHVMFGGLTHQPAIDLAQTLLAITDKRLDKIFFADSGSVAVEVAMKMALQYFFAQGKQQKQQFLTVRSGYHGDTFGAMSVCDPVTGMHHLFQGVLAPQLFVPAPYSITEDHTDHADIDALEMTLKTQHHTIAAVIIEPIVQGAGGMRIYRAEYLQAVRRLCNQYEVVLIFDEIATGFGRTGKLFAYQHAQVVPDILCLGKALTGGYMTLAATLTTELISSRISACGALMHGPTFMANPLACAVANASIQLLLASDWEQKVLAIEQQLQQQLMRCDHLSSVREVRVIGAIGVVEMYQAVDMQRMPEYFVEQNVWVRPFGKLVYIMPPYIISKEQLEILINAMYKVLAQYGDSALNE